MHIRQVGVELHGLLKLFDSFVVLIAVQRGLAHKHVIFRSVLPQLEKSGERAILDIRLAGLVRRIAEHVEIIQIVGLLRPQRIEKLHRVGVLLGEKITEPQQIARLYGLWLITHH